MSKNTDNSRYWFYPEVANRSLEEIDLIFAKGYVENISYVKASKELPKLDVEGMERLAVQYGLTDETGLKKAQNDGSSLEKNSAEHLSTRRSS